MDTCRFGTIPFTLIRTSSAEKPEWVPDFRIVTFHFPGGNVNETQSTGQGVMRMQGTARFRDTDTFETFLAAVTTRQTLRVPFLATAYPGNRQGQEFDALWKEFDAVLVSGVENIRLHHSGAVDCRVTFERDPA